MAATKRVGIFGGSFNPIHFGQINAMMTVYEKMNFDEMLVLPANRSPFSTLVQGPTPNQRLEMVKLGLEEVGAPFEVSDMEIQRGGVSYTVDTLSLLVSEDISYSFVIGLDQFEVFDKWKDFEKILSMVDLVVASRPGSQFPQELDEFAPGLRPIIEDVQEDKVLLTSGRKIHFVQLDDLEISSTEIRKSLREGKSVENQLPPKVLEFVDRNKLYQPVADQIDDNEAFTRRVADILMSKNALNVAAYDLDGLIQPSDYVVVASGTSARHASALAEHLAREVKKEFKFFPQNIEGLREGRWVVLDYGILMVHLFYDFVRSEYKLEELWEDGKELQLETRPAVSSDQ